MKNLYLGLISILAISCGGESTDAVEENENMESCVYRYDESTTTVNWTAFKFTERKGVGGTFNSVNVLISEASENMFNTLTGATFTIPVKEVNSKNPDRDLKIKTHFFGSMQSTDFISGLIKSINETSAIIEITMNGMSNDYEGLVNIEGEKITFSTTINLDHFEAQVSVDSLNSVCNDLHKGADGVSKLWSEVEISVETTLKKECK